MKSPRPSAPLFKIVFNGGRREIWRLRPNALNIPNERDRYRKGNNPACAVCANNWKGTNQTTWICKPCKRDGENTTWRSVASDETAVDDMTTFEAGDSATPDSGAGVFENALAIEIMRLYCMDVGPVEAIGRILSVSTRWVYRVIEYWNEHYGYLVSELRTTFATVNKEAV